MPHTELAAGHVVAGRYRLVARLGEGGMGAVWRADHVTLRSHVAIKFLHRAALDSDESLKRFLREAQAAAMLRSPHVVQILDHGVDDGIPYIAMELLDGESLAARLARVSALSLAETARVVTHVARAIGKAHDAGIIHRDLKPDNIFLVHNDDEEVVKVLDFGIAKMEPAVAEPAGKISTREGALLGTPHYMSPEQVRGSSIDWRSDLWSLAIIAFECACGRLPFAGRTVGDLLVLICSEPLPVPSTLRPLPPAFDAWFARAASRDVEGRFQSAREMAEALRAAIGEEPRPIFSTPPAAPAGEIASRHTTERLDTNTPALHEAPTLDVDRAALENAQTLAPTDPVSTPAGAAPRPARAPRILAGAVVVGALCVAAWLALADRGSAHPGPATTEARSAIAPPSAPVPIAAPPPVPTTDASGSAAAQPTATASAQAAPSAKAPPRVKSPPKTDVLVF